MSDTNQNTQQPKKKTLVERVKSGVHFGKKMVLVGRIGLSTAVVGTTAGAAYHLHRQFHKSPAQIQQETEEMKKEVNDKVQEVATEIGGSNTITRTVGKIAGKVAEKGASHGGKAREWIARKLQKTQ